MICEPVARHLAVRGESGKTFVVLHGYASRAVQIRDFFKDWIVSAGGASFLFLEGAAPSYGMGGFGWLPLTSNQVTLANHLQKLAPFVEQYISCTIAREGLGEELVLVGHSQGAMLALEVVAQKRITVSGVIAISGMYPVPARICQKGNGQKSEFRKFPKVMFIHERADPMIPVGLALESEQAFRKYGFDTCMWVLEGSQHALSRAYVSKVFSLVSSVGDVMAV